MTVTKDRHLTLVDATAAAQLAAGEAFSLAVAYATGTHGSAPVPADVLDQLDGLDADHQTACDVLDLAAADVDQARRELSEAARRLADAEERWARAGIVADETSRAVVAAREAAGLVLTASGYRNGVGR